jgi:hypothetical protein
MGIEITDQIAKSIEFVTAPKWCLPCITPGKQYKVYFADRIGFYFDTDAGVRTCSRWTRAPYLHNQDWIISDA